MRARDGLPRRARDVMAFGQETGRVLSDGRIVGRAEPFAKVFQSSRLVKQAVGLTAWGILEDIALDATLDVEGRLVAETSTRRIAENLGLNKDTVARHLGRLREFGFVLHEEVRHHGSGRWETARYVLDPSACLERFTTTPGSRQNRSSGTCTERPDTAKPVSGNAGHGATGHGESGHQQQDVVASLREQQQQTAAVLAELLALGIDDQTARSLVAHHSPARIHDVAAAAPRRANRNQAGWAVRALEGGWALEIPPPPRPAAAPASLPTPDIVVAADDAIDDAVEARWRAWDQAVSDTLSDEELPAAVEASCATLPPSGRIVPAVRAQLIRWAAAALHAKGGNDLRRALLDALNRDARRTPGDAAATRADESDASRDDVRPAQVQLPWPPATDQAALPLRDRLSGVLAQGAARASDSRPTGFAQAGRGEL